MATWNEIKNFLNSRNLITDEKNDLLFCEAVFPKINRKQTFIVGKKQNDYIGEMVFIASPIGTIPLNNLNSALEKLFNIGFGKISYFEGVHVISESMHLANSTIQYFEEILNIIVRYADAFEEEFVGGDNN
jgi:hypothetical protein